MPIPSGQKSIGKVRAEVYVLVCDASPPLRQARERVEIIVAAKLREQAFILGPVQLRSSAVVQRTEPTLALMWQAPTFPHAGRGSIIGRGAGRQIDIAAATQEDRTPSGTRRRRL